MRLVVGWLALLSGAAKRTPFTVAEEMDDAFSQPSGVTRGGAFFPGVEFIRRSGPCAGPFDVEPV